MSHSLDTWESLLLGIGVVIALVIVARLNDRFFDWVKSRISYRRFVSIALAGVLLSTAIAATLVWKFLQSNDAMHVTVTR